MKKEDCGAWEKLFGQYCKEKPMYWILRSEEDMVFFIEKGKIKSLCFEMGDIKKSIPLSKKSFNALKGITMGAIQTHSKKDTYNIRNLPIKVEKVFEMTIEIFE